MKKLYKFVLYTFVLLLGPVSFFSAPLFAQTGAGGVGNASTLPMWYDANELSLTDGSLIFQVDDISGNNNHLTQVTSSRRPVFTETGLNGLPVMTFDGVNDYLTRGATSGLGGTNLTYFIVFQRAANLNQSLIDAGYSAEVSKWTTYSLGSNNRLVSLHRNPAKFVYHIDNATPTFVSTHITSTNLRQYRQGTLQQNLNTPYTAATGHNLIRVGAYNYNLTTGYYLNGFIAEIIVYNSALNNLERIIVENYLGAKYNMAIPNDLYAYESTNNVGLIAIGNNGTNTQTTATGYGALTLSNPTAMTANEYCMIAHTNVDLSLFTTTGLPASIPSHQYFTRTWRVGETGDVGDVTLTFDLSGGNDFADPTSYRLLVDSDDDFSDATVLTGTYDGGTETVTFVVNLNDGQYFTLAGLFQSLVINSITSGDWSNTATWDCTCTPGPFDQVFIQPTHSVEVDVNANTLDLEIVSGGTLTMNTGNELNIGGNFNNFGTFTAGSGTVIFNGSVTQVFNDLGIGTEFNNITIDNDAGTVQFLASQIILNGTLELVNGNLDLTDSGMNFIVNSTSATGGGRIGAIQGSAVISGEISVRRFIPGGNPDWRDICSPVIGATFVDWDADLAMSGPSFPDGCASGGGDPCFKSVRYTFNGTTNYVLDANDPITNGRGYYLWMADDLTSFSGTTLTSTGTINGTADINKTLANGWHTIGNPYVSQILFSSATKTSNVGNYFYVYDNTIGDYQWYDGASGTASIPELDNGLMAIGQSVWIYYSGTGTLTFHQTDKTSTNATYIRSQESAVADDNLYVKLREHNTTFESSIMISENDFANDGLDSLMDMQLLENGHEAASRLSIVSDETSLKKNFIRKDARNKAFNLNTNIKRAGYYSLELSNFESFMAYRHILLYDSGTNEFIDLKKELTYTFYSEIFDGNRFTLILTNEETSSESTVQSLTINETTLEVDSQMTITQMGHSFNVDVTENMTEDSQVKLVNVLGQTEVYSSTIRFVEGSNMITVPAELKGVHILIITTGSKMVTKKVVL